MNREKWIQRVIPIKFSFEFQNYDHRSTAHYKVKLRTEHGSATFPFFQGSGIKEEPTLTAVLYCLLSDARSGDMDLIDFMSEFGYDIEQRKEASSILTACKKNREKLKRLGILAFEEELNDIFQDY